MSLTRRRLILAAAAGLVAEGATGPVRSQSADQARPPAAPPVAAPAYPKFDLVAGDLKIPEGPVLGAAGGIVLSELGRRAVTRVHPNGMKEQVVAIEGIPCGLAMGPNGALYITVLGYNAPQPKGGTKTIPGKIQRFNFASGKLDDVVTLCDGRPLRSPDDLVFDAKGGFYFTDVGIPDPTGATLDETGIYYFDGANARRLVGPEIPTNGIGISPSGDRLYWTEYVTGRLYARQIVSPGVLEPPDRPNGDCLFIHPTPVTLFNSVKVDAEGCVSIAVHDGTPTGKSGIMSFRPDGEPIDFVPFPDPTTTNLVLSWEGPKVAYVTLGRTGRLVKLPWPRAGLAPRFRLPAGY